MVKQAVILAAGEGRRLRPLTNEIPKPMVSVCGRPILEHTLSILPPAVNETIVVIGYRGEKIKQYFGSQFGRVKISYVRQDEPRGTGDALLAARPSLKKGNFLLLHADDLYHPEDLKDCAKEGPTVLVKETEEPERFGVCIIGPDGLLCDILEKRKNPPTNLANIGVYTLNEEIFEIPSVKLGDEFVLASQIGEWAKKRPVKIVKARFWHPIGYPDDLDLAEEYLKIPLKSRSN